MRRGIELMAVYGFLYVFLFLLMPLVYPVVYISSNESGVVFIGITVAMVLMAMVAHADKGRWHLLGLSFYGLLMLIYVPPGAYGIGMVGMNLDGMSSFYQAGARYYGIVFVLIFNLIVQLVTWLLVKLYRILRSKH